MPDCVGIKFENGPKIHYMESPPEAPLLDSFWLVSSRRGVEFGRVRTAPKNHSEPSGRVIRAAQIEDIEHQRQLAAKADDLKWLVRARARQNGVAAKIVSLEFTFDEKVLVVSYTSERQVPLRVLARLLKEHTLARIEFQNIGPRDQARILGTLGACGDGNCSSKWLQSFHTVGIRMARDQQLPLNPDKITGPCGRLKCCLQYEHEHYKVLLKGMPKKGGRACHKETGVCGRIVALNPLHGTVGMRRDEGGTVEYRAEEVERIRGGGN
jgi:cell fate regulator YaaT (PSP1 superfamily)